MILHAHTRVLSTINENLELCFKSGQKSECLILILFLLKKLISKFQSTVGCDPNALYFMRDDRVLREERPEQICVT